VEAEMIEYQANVRTENASRYLQQLCKHWSHKFATEFDLDHGVIHLNGAKCIFDAEPERLLLTLKSDDKEAFPRLCDVVTEHLKRFAFREEMDIRWAEAAYRPGAA
jgi:hypothetical protein